MQSYTGHCPRIPEFGRYLDAIGVAYKPNFLRLVASCADYGTEMHTEDEKHGVLALVGDEDIFPRIVRGQEFVKDAAVNDISQSNKNVDILSDPERMHELLHRLGDLDVDGAVLFSEEGRLVGVEAYVNSVDINELPGNELEHIRLIKGNGYPGTKHIAALFATTHYPVQAVVTSESKKHTTMAMCGRRVSNRLTYDPETGLFGRELLVHRLQLDEPDTREPLLQVA